MKETLICSGNQTAPFVHRFEFSRIVSEEEKCSSETQKQEVMEPHLNNYGTTYCSRWKKSASTTSTSIKVLETETKPKPKEKAHR